MYILSIFYSFTPDIFSFIRFRVELRFLQISIRLFRTWVLFAESLLTSLPAVFTMISVFLVFSPNSTYIIDELFLSPSFSTTLKQCLSILISFLTILASFYHVLPLVFFFAHWASSSWSFFPQSTYVQGWVILWTKHFYFLVFWAKFRYVVLGWWDHWVTRLAL